MESLSENGRRFVGSDTEAALLARSQELTAQLELALDAIFARDARRRITFWNKGALETYGFSSAEALGRTPSELLRTEYPVPLEEIERIVTETGSWEGDLVQHNKDGHPLAVESRWAARYDEEGRLTGMLEVNRDIGARLETQAEAERVKLRNQLQQAHRLESLGQLAGGIAHDFNNLLAVIINYTAFVADDLEAAIAIDGDERWKGTREDLHQVRLAGERAAQLTHQLLAFARREVVQPEVVDVNDVVTGIEQLLRRTIGEHVELRSDLVESACHVLIDPGQLEQILVNLAVNARDAMPDGGLLRIDTANVEIEQESAAARPELVPGPYVRLRASDTGVGMSSDVLVRVFDPFFTTKPPGQGTGLGLATVYGIVQQAGGRAQIYSEPGVGTTFTALFPATEQAPVRSEPRPAPIETRGEETVLLVEDEDALRQVVQRILTRGGYRVIVASNGPEALGAAERHHGAIDLLLTDVIMPQMPGPQLAEHLQKVRPATQVLFMSGFAAPILDSTDKLKDGMSLIEKPFSGSALLAKIDQVLVR
jgi:two-component system, cell cycle sensor histidine kinase and response regulator CckA